MCPPLNFEFVNAKSQSMLCTFTIEKMLYSFNFHKNRFFLGNYKLLLGYNHHHVIRKIILLFIYEFCHNFQYY